MSTEDMTKARNILAEAEARQRSLKKITAMEVARWPEWERAHLFFLIQLRKNLEDAAEAYEAGDLTNAAERFMEFDEHITDQIAKLVASMELPF